jgi:hypothetical protein
VFSKRFLHSAELPCNGLKLFFRDAREQFDIVLNQWLVDLFNQRGACARKPYLYNTTVTGVAEALDEACLLETIQ